MCVKSCVGFTGLFADLEHCPECGSARYKESDGNENIPQKVFTTFPVGPQLQARWKHPETAKNMSYRWEKTREFRQEHPDPNEPPELYDNILSGASYRKLVDDNVIEEYDTVLMLAIDGVQLYQSKESDC